MRILDALRFRLATLFRRSQMNGEIEDEVRSHIQLRADDLERYGLARREAERRARIEFGGQARFREEIHDAAGGAFIESVFRDVGFALRVLRKSPSFALVSVFTLAVAIAANTVAFAALNALILRPLDVPQAQRVYGLSHVGDAFAYDSYPNYVDYRDRNHSFEELAANNMCQAGLDTGNNPARAWGYEVSGNYFDTLRLQPYLGRLFHASDEHGPNSAPYIVLAYAYWESHFQGERSVVGRTVRLNKHPFTIIGVAPPGFRGGFQAFSADFFVPIVNQEQIDGENLLNARANSWISGLFGRLRPGVTAAQAAADLNSIHDELQKTYPKEEGKVTFALPHIGMADAFGGALSAFLAALMLMAVLILLAACSNLGSLFAARAADRSREIAMRLALGSTRRRILRQLFTEAILISLTGGALGIWGSVLLLQWISAWRPFPEFPLNIPLSPDAHVYAMALLLALASGFLFGAVPVRQVLRTNPYGVIKSGSPVAMTRRVTARDLLLAVQIALCAVLVTSSFVAVRGLVRSLHSHLGVEPRNAMLVETDLRAAGYTGERVPEMQKRMIDAMKTIPGVTSVGLVSVPPLHMGWDITGVFTDKTTDLRMANVATNAITYSISPDYFEAARTALLRGRTFTWNDNKEAPRIAIVNQEFARQVLGSPSAALNGYFKLGNGTRIQVVGIVQNGKYTANLAEDKRPAMFFPILQSPSSDSWLVVRSNGPPQQLAAALRAELRQLDPGLVPFIQTWNEEMNGALFAPRMATASLGILGLMGAMLSITGIFGMAAYSVSKRRRELGIRIALGAQPRELLRAALGRAFRLLAFGSAVGLALGILASRVLASIVYQASPRDPLVLTGVVLAMLLIGLLATWIPAQRALSIDPLILLREE